MRIWNNKVEDDGSVHSMGNGKILVFNQGPNIINYYGPPYSNPSFFKCTISENRNVCSKSIRETGTAIWHHEISREGTVIGSITDFILPERNIFIREINLKEDLNLQLSEKGPLMTIVETQRANQGEWTILEDYFRPESQSLLMRLPKGSLFFTDEPVIRENNLIMTSDMQVRISKCEGDNVYDLIVPAGKGRLVFSSNENFPNLIDDINYSLQSGNLIENVRTYWKNFTLSRIDFSKRIPEDHYLRDEILKAIDSMSIILKTQQSDSGGISAGHFYPMGYVRDQYGMLRALLALGYPVEAKGVLSFWWNKWKLFGSVLNAEGMGNNAARLHFLNDEVEVPSYIILSAVHYYNKTEDSGFIKEIYPMLKWAFEVQINHIRGGMLEFSGDETYIAGEIYPKYQLYQGSAESTLIFLVGGEWLVNYSEKKRLIDSEEIKSYKTLLEDVRSSYKENFIKDGILYANNPKREVLAGRPQFRYGFCDAHEILDRELILSWTERNGEGYYVCPSCRKRVIPKLENPNLRYILNSVNLVVKFHENSLFSDSEIKKIIQDGVNIFKKTNRVPSCLNSTKSLGYDYGLLLHNAVKLNLDIKENILAKTISLMDSADAWAEYYDENDKPFNCRCRTWEGAINIEGIIAYIESLKQ